MSASALLDRLCGAYSPPASVLAHPSFSIRDYAYLRAKGHSDAGVLAIWSRDWPCSGPCHWAGPLAEKKLLAVLRRAVPLAV